MQIKFACFRKKNLSQARKCDLLTFYSLLLDFYSQTNKQVTLYTIKNTLFTILIVEISIIAYKIQSATFIHPMIS